MYVKNPFATIAAISTPPGKGGIAVIRISGEDTGKILKKCFEPYGDALEKQPFRTAVYGKIIKGGVPVDTGICVMYAEGKSFTGELSAELSCHGGVYITGEVLEAVFDAGAEPAGRGEFTKRAFINGKLTLSEAEAVGQLIDADTKSKASLASGAARGNLSLKLSGIDKKLFDAVTALYAAIDYPEEDVGNEGENKIYGAVCETFREVARLSSTYRTGKAVTEGIKTVICGKPNVGKSSFYNMILGEERAIVTNIAGTTRDILEDTADIGGVTLRLSDTAGLHTAQDAVEKIGVEKALEKIESAELLIAVFDSSCPLDRYEKDFIYKIKELPAEKICVLNKTDLKCGLADEDKKLLCRSFENSVKICAKSGAGIDRFSEMVSELYNKEKLSLTDDALIWDSAQKASLDRAAELLSEAKEALESGAPLDVVGVVCERALSELRRVDGRDVSEDIISAIFSRFCVGK